MSPADVVESSGLRAAGYAVTGLICVVAASREAASQSAVRWRAFWYLTAAVLVAMALARAIGIDDLLTQLGREQARLDGWYRTRRRLQAALVGTVAATWIVVVFVSIWRVPERRRRYLPTALAAFTIMCFAAARSVSLHHVDAVLYHRSIAGVPVVAIAEWSLLALTATAIIVSPSLGLHRDTRVRTLPTPVGPSSKGDHVSASEDPTPRGLLRLVPGSAAPTRDLGPVVVAGGGSELPSRR